MFWVNKLWVFYFVYLNSGYKNTHMIQVSPNFIQLRTLGYNPLTLSLSIPRCHDALIRPFIDHHLTTTFVSWYFKSCGHDYILRWWISRGRIKIKKLIRVNPFAFSNFRWIGVLKKNLIIILPIWNCLLMRKRACWRTRMHSRFIWDIYMLETLPHTYTCMLYKYVFGITNRYIMESFNQTY